MNRYLLLSLILFASAPWAEPVVTDVTVRVQAHDAKFIGTGVGELNVVFEDADTGTVLATGRISGGTGDTERLVNQPRGRSTSLSDGNTAGYTARLMLERPQRVRIRVVGPLAQPAAVQQLSVTTWVVPGRPIGGDGIVLTMPGLIVSPLIEPATGRQLPLVADVTLMCGCPITRDGLWDADDYEVRAEISSREGESTSVALGFTGETNRFAGKARLRKAGRYTVTVWAHNATTGNTGAASYTMDVR